MKSIIVLVLLLVPCFAAVQEQTSFLRRKDVTADRTFEGRDLSSKGKGGKGKGSSKAPKNSSKSPSKSKGKGGKGKGSSKSPKKSKGKGKGGKGKKSSKSPKKKGGKNKKGGKGGEACIPPQDRNAVITEIVEDLSGGTIDDLSPEQRDALALALSSPGTGNTCETRSEVSQLYSLAVFFYATNGSSWFNSMNWGDSSVSVCDWFGIICKDGEIVVIKLENNNLSGYLPMELGNISSLVEVKLFKNSIGGLMPSSIGSLPKLKILDVEENQMYGDLFEGRFFELSDTLIELRVSFNNFGGSIPDLSAFGSLERIWLANNTFTGDLPDSITNLSGLKQLKVQGNKITGALPENLGNMVALEELHTNGNVGMSGNIPKSISKLEKLRYLNVADNGLRGTIPSGFSKLSNLEYALLFDNELSGEIPSLQAFTKLRFFVADNNNLRGKIPSFSSSTKAYFIDLSGNQFTGEIPGELLGLPELEFLYLDDNRLSGQIPFNFGNSTSLIDLYLQDNQLTGNIPAFNGFLPKITELSLNNNDLSGNVPTDICSNRESRLDPANPYGVFSKLWVDCNGPVSCPPISNRVRCCTTCYPL